MATGRERFIRQQIETRLAATTPDQLDVAQVTAVTAGGGTDGLPLVTVRHRGTTRGYAHLPAAYPSPAVGDVVVLTRSGGTWLILGPPGGFPPAT